MDKAQLSTTNDNMERYTCQKCTRHFVASNVAVKIPCPNCNFENILRPDKVNTTAASPTGLPAVPRYTLEEASKVAKALIAESVDSGDWTKVAVSYDGVDGCWSKPIAVNINNEKVFCNKAVATIDANPEQVLSVYWNSRLELEWNSTTVQRVTLLEDLSSIQLIHHEIKKNPTVAMQNDVVFRRAYDKNPDKSIWVYAVSDDKAHPVKSPFTRGIIVFGGVLITPIGTNKSRVTLIWCFDYNKKLQVRYSDEEPKKTALRLCRIKKAIDEAAVSSQKAAEYAKQKAAAGISD